MSMCVCVYHPFREFNQVSCCIEVMSLAIKSRKVVGPKLSVCCCNYEAVSYGT